MKKILFALGLFLAIGMAVPERAEALRCHSYIGFGTGGSCTAWKPDLIPGGRDVADNYSPVAYEMVICAAYNYVTYCQATDVRSYASVADLAPINPGWYGNYAVPNGMSGNLYIRSVRAGLGAQGMFCQGANYTGTCTIAGPSQSIGVLTPTPRSFAVWLS